MNGEATAALPPPSGFGDLRVEADDRAAAAAAPAPAPDAGADASVRRPRPGLPRPLRTADATGLDADPSAQAETRLHTMEWALLGAIVAALVAVLVATLWKAHDGVGLAERDRLLGQARVIEENVAQQLLGLDRALLGVRDEVLSAPGAARGASTSQRLRMLTEVLPAVRSMVVLDDRGLVVASAVDSMLGVDFSSRPYFQQPRDLRESASLHVTPPHRTPLGSSAMMFSRAIVDRDGRFRGVVMAALEPDYFEVLLRSVLYAPDMWAAIGHGAGRVFVTMPRDADRLEGRWQEDLVKRARDGDGPVVLAPVGSGASRRLTVVRELASPVRLDTPLVIAVSRDGAAAWREWNRQALQYATLTLLLGGGAGVMLRRSHRHRRAEAARQAAALAERRTHALQLELALGSADMGLWSWEIATDRFTHRLPPSLRFGFSEDELDQPGFDWRQRIHRDDAMQMIAAIEAHLRGDVGVFAAEFRLRRKDGGWSWVSSRGRVVEHDAQGSPVRMAGTHMDVTERKLTDERLARSLELLRRTGELADIGGWEVDLATQRLSWTEAIYRIHELPAGAPVTLESAIEFYAPDAQPVIAAAFAAAVAHGESWDLELPLVTAKGNPRWVRTQGMVQLQGDRAVRVFGAFQNITERKTTALELHRVNEQLRRLSTTDALTEVGNRRLFDQTLRTEWARAARRGEPVGLLMIDIDHFKEYNDHYGHPAGDACLRQVARLIGDAMRRGGELVARYGGEEFALLLPGADLAEARLAAERCSEVVAQAGIQHHGSPTGRVLTVSIGIASRRAEPGLDGHLLVDLADAALYRAKRHGRGRIEA